MITAVFAALSFYLIPYIVGSVFVRHAIHKKIPSSLWVFLSYTIGVLFLYGFTLLTAGLQSILHVPFSPTSIKGGMIAIIFYGLVETIATIPQKSLRHWIQTHGWTTIALFLVAIISYTFWRWDSPYPNALNWDIYEHQTIVESMLKGNISFITSHISDTFQFNGYSTIFHVLLTIPEFIWQPNILGYWWFLEFFHLITVIGVLYIFAYNLTRHRIIGLLTAIIGAFSFETSVVYGSLFLIPQTLTGVLGIYIFALLFEEKYTLAFLLPGVVCIMLMHYIVGGFGVSICILYYISKLPFFSKQKHSVFIYILIACFICLGLSYAAYYFHANLLNAGEAAYYTNSIWEKLATVQNWYSIIPFILFPIGFLEMRTYMNASKQNTFIFLLFIFLGVIFAKAPYVLKFYTLGRAFVFTTLAFGFWFFFQHIRHDIYKIIIAFGYTFIILVLYINTITSWKESLITFGTATHVSEDEQNGALFLRKYYANKNALLLSDPATQYVLEALSGINSPGGAYAKESTRKTFSDALESKDPHTFITYITQIKDGVQNQSPDVYLLVLNGRTLTWLSGSNEDKWNIIYNVWKPTPFAVSHKIAMQKLITMLQLAPIYENESIAIFEIHQ